MKPEEIRPGRRYMLDYGKICEVVQIEYLNYRKDDTVDYVDQKGDKGSMPLPEFASRAKFEILKFTWGG